jgi:hypothetical protein
MLKLLSNLKLKTKRVILLFYISLMFAFILISLLKYKNIIYINKETINKICVIVRQIQNKTINFKKLEYCFYLF